ncbi:MAG: hypothetical protein FJ279_11890 [Planctomycetes bacterium]|nr:hypothetical protein [Planctomycetota bacterium]MBM4078515.1 hypothetical protein [Planctomycetota bacterium]
MTFKAAVLAVPQLRGAYCPGLQALRERDRDRIECRGTRRLAGSINLETALPSASPHEPRWDYGIGHGSGHEDEAIWVEVHPASSHHVTEVIRKAQWLKGWLRRHASALLTMTRKPDGYVWLATGTVSLQRGSRQARQLALAGVAFPQRRLRLS